MNSVCQEAAYLLPVSLLSKTFRERKAYKSLLPALFSWLPHAKQYSISRLIEQILALNNQTRIDVGGIEVAVEYKNLGHVHSLVAI